VPCRCSAIPAHAWSGGSSPDAACCVTQASTASRSTRSFITSLLWPFTQRNVISPGRDSYRSMKGSHRSWFATGLRCLFFQPFAFHFTYHLCSKQFFTYVESVTISSWPGWLRAASNAALISILGLVVWGAKPLAQAPSGSAQAQPPGPGFPAHAPSVYVMV